MIGSVSLSSLRISGICFPETVQTVLYSVLIVAYYNLKSVKTISQYNKKHNDIKPSNFLIKEEGSLLDDKNELLLSDFGFMNERKGGTPLYASPECFHGTMVEKSDIYSLGGCFVSLLSNDKIFAKLLILPLLTKYEIELAEIVLNQNSLMQLAKKMMNSDPLKRPSIDAVIEAIEKTEVDEFQSISKNNRELNQLLHRFSQGRITELIQEHLITIK